jgi:hypothetical protein
MIYLVDWCSQSTLRLIPDSLSPNHLLPNCLIPVIRAKIKGLESLIYPPQKRFADFLRVHILVIATEPEGEVP